MKNKGIVSLAAVLVIALFLFSVGVLLGIQSGTSIFTGFSEKNSAIAQALVEAGIQDAVLKIARDHTTTGSYVLTETDGSVSITITAGTPIVVVATSTVAKPLGTIKRAMRASVSVDGDGRITDLTKMNL